MNGGRNGGQNHSLAKQIASRDQDQLTPQIKTTNNTSAGVQSTRPGRCLLRPECAIYERRRDRGSANIAVLWEVGLYQGRPGDDGDAACDSDRARGNGNDR
jgi:hypothetical protein